MRLDLRIPPFLLVTRQPATLAAILSHGALASSFAPPDLSSHEACVRGVISGCITVFVIVCVIASARRQCQRLCSVAVPRRTQEGVMEFSRSAGRPALVRCSLIPLPPSTGPLNQINEYPSHLFPGA